MLLEGTTMVVSGVGPGLGREIAEAAGREGANVVIGARTEANLKAAADAIDPSGERVAWRVTDITRPEDCDALADLAVSRFGGLDSLCNCAALDVGKTDDRDVGDLRVRVEDPLDLLRRDVLALPDDDVLQPAADDEVTVGVETAQVAGAEEPVGVERVRVERGVDVALEELRPADADLADVTRFEDAVVVADDADLDTRRRSPVGDRELRIGIVDRAERQARALRQPVARRDADAADLRLDLGVQRRRFR